MTDAEAYQAIENSDPEMGSNWLIDTGTVYQVCMWAMGGVAFRRKYVPGDYGYESAYRTAVTGKRTLFPFMWVKSSEGAK